MNKKNYVLAAAAIVVLGGCLAAIGFTGGGDAKWDPQFTGDDLKYSVVSQEKSTVTVSGYDKASSKLTIPELVTHKGNTYTVVSVAESAFKGCTTITALTIPDTVTSLGAGAFKNCKDLSDLTIPVNMDCVVDDSDPVFGGCKNIHNLTFIGGIESGFGRDYSDNTKTPWYLSRATLHTLVILPDVKSIGDNTFAGCEGLKSITFGSGLESISETAFPGYNLYDTDGVTKFSRDVGQLKGNTFQGKMDRMMKVIL